MRIKVVFSLGRVFGVGIESEGYKKGREWFKNEFYFIVLFRNSLGYG